MKYLLDTNVIIDYLKGQARMKTMLAGLKVSSPFDFSVNPIVLAEVLSGMRPEESAVTEDLFRQMTLYGLDGDDAHRAAEFRRRYGSSHGVTLPDALIAATAVRYRLTLVTQNTRHFPMPELTLQAL